MAKEKKFSTIQLVEGAVMLALATVLSFIKVFKLPWGGSITLLSMLPICLYSIKYGIGKGLMVSFVYSLIQMFISLGEVMGWGLTKSIFAGCLLLDYILAFTALGVAGIARKKGLSGWLLGTVLAMMLRYLFHFLSGVILWKSTGKIWSGFSTENYYLYSLVYNGTFMLPEIVFTTIGSFILYKLPVTKTLLKPRN